MARKKLSQNISPISKHAHFVSEEARDATMARQSGSQMLARLRWSNTQTVPDDRLSQIVGKASPAERADIARRSLTLAELVLLGCNLKGTWQGYSGKLLGPGKMAGILRQPIQYRSKFDEVEETGPVRWGARVDGRWQIAQRQEPLLAVEEDILVYEGDEYAGIVRRGLSLVRSSLFVAERDLFEIESDDTQAAGRFSSVTPDSAEQAERSVSEYAKAPAEDSYMVPAFTSLVVRSEIDFSPEV